MRAKMGHAVPLWVEQAETVEHHGFDRLAGGHNPPCWGWLRRLVDDLGDPECFNHAGDQAQVIEDERAVWLWLRRDGRTVRVSHRLLLCTGECIDTPALLNDM